MAIFSAKTTQAVIFCATRDKFTNDTLRLFLLFLYIFVSPTAAVEK